MHSGLPMTNPLEIFGATVRKIRKRQGLSQEDLAALCGLHRTYVGGIERGERNVALINILQIAKALKVTPGELFHQFDIAANGQLNEKSND
jgi:transcriptional regulator with XRE-family HTH domain